MYFKQQRQPLAMLHFLNSAPKMVEMVEMAGLFSTGNASLDDGFRGWFGSRLGDEVRSPVSFCDANMVLIPDFSCPPEKA